MTSIERWNLSGGLNLRRWEGVKETLQKSNSVLVQQWQSGWTGWPSITLGPMFSRSYRVSESMMTGQIPSHRSSWLSLSWRLSQSMFRLLGKQILRSWWFPRWDGRRFSLSWIGCVENKYFQDYRPFSAHFHQRSSSVGLPQLIGSSSYAASTKCLVRVKHLFLNVVKCQKWTSWNVNVEYFVY